MSQLDMCLILNTFSSEGIFKPWKPKKQHKYAEHYQQQRLALAPMVAITLGQLGPNCLQFLWILADNDAQTQLHLDLESLPNDITTQGSNTSPYSIDSHWCYIPSF